MVAARAPGGPNAGHRAAGLWWISGKNWRFSLYNGGDCEHFYRMRIRVSSRLIALTGCLAVVLLSACSTTVRNNVRSYDTVVIDAGHGGHDPGAVSRRGTREKDVNLDVARRLDRNLRAAGIKTVMTRNDDRFITLGNRTRTSNRYRNAVFVSIHFNSSRRRSARGMETFYYHPYGRKMAGYVQRSMTAVSSAPDRGVKHARFYVIRNNLNPAVLVECAFLSNWREDALARSSAYRQLMADSIARGLLEMRHGRGFRPSSRARLASHHDPVR